MKEYIKPKTEIMDISLMQMIAASNFLPVTDDYADDDIDIQVRGEQGQYDSEW